MSYLLESGDLQRHIFQTLQPTYARRYRSMMAAIEEYLIPLGVTLPQTSRDMVGGYFIWLTLPKPLSAKGVAMLAKKDRNLVIAPGNIFAITGDKKPAGFFRQVRVCFSWEQEEMLAEGIRRLGWVISSIQTSRGHHKKAKTQPPGDTDSLVDQYR